MKALIQRVKHAKVEVAGETVAAIQLGLLAFIGVEKQDTQENVNKLLNKILNYRVFADHEGKMNLSLLDIAGDLLLVSQFTLVANTNKGLRPSFSSAATPVVSKELYDYCIKQAQLSGINVQTGIFAADMQVSLINDGPVTFNLQC
ncbi:MAG: D-aminoacyl-tRNA deacylase [Proteobacteria bacterium]|nr:D-aminoacyl-tRNA deacylase [Pseudomonadota bacterium]